MVFSESLHLIPMRLLFDKAAREARLTMLAPTRKTTKIAIEP
ncbi:MAG: hypothetical protein ACI9LY_001450, partial [Arenicella sp.]